MKSGSRQKQNPLKIPFREDRGIFRMNWHFYSWEKNRWDYKIIALCLDHFRDVGDASKFLDKANEFLLPGHNYIFDGTIRCLLFLLHNHMINIDFIPDPNLHAILKRFAENPHDPIDIPISPMIKSFQASLCKLVPINIYMMRDKIRIDSRCIETINFFQHGTLDQLVDPDGKQASLLNSLWIGLGSYPWNLDVTQNLSEFVAEQTVESLRENSGLNRVFAIIQPIITSIVKKYLPDYFEDHPAKVAVRLAATMIFYNALDHRPESSKSDRTVWPEGEIEHFAEDVVWCIMTPNHKLKGWFKKYFIYEMDKRAKLISTTAETKFDEKGNKLVRYFYFPVYEYFRFINVNYLPRLWGCMKIFKDESFSIYEKDEIAKYLVFSIQNVVLQLIANENSGNDQSDHDKRLHIHENKTNQPLKETLEGFMLAVIEPMRKRIYTSLSSEIKSRLRLGENCDDIYQSIYSEAITTILEYDESKNSSFFGYLKKSLINKVRSKLRLKRFENELVIRQESEADDDEVDTIDNMAMSLPEFDEEIDRSQLKKVISDALDSLSSKERAVIEKTFFMNQSLSETERRMKNRALRKLQANYKSLEEYFGVNP